MTRVLAIFPDRGGMWRPAEDRLRTSFGDAVSFAYDLNRGGAAITDAEIVLSFALAADAARAATKLRWVQALGTGTDGIALPPERDVIVTTAHGLHGPAVSEAALAMMLAHVRSFDRVMQDQAARRWQPYASALLAGATLGILGTGTIAKALARRAAAFDMRVIGFSASPRPMQDFDEVLHRTALRGTAGRLDHLVLLAPLDPATRGIVDAPTIASLKPGALLVNVGRGGLVDEAALIAALGSGQIAAALDVFAEEPLSAVSPLWAMPNVLVSPHSAGRHVRYVDDVMNVFFENFQLFEKNEISRMTNLSAKSADRSYSIVAL